MIDEYFREDKLKAMLVWMAAQSGPPPTEPMSGPFVLWHPLYHEGGIARPRGGSGMLTQALKSHIEAHGGDVMVNSPADEILVEGTCAVGVRVDGRAYTSRAVVSGTHILETLTRLLPEPFRKSAAARQMRVGNGFGAILRLALDKPIQYRADPSEEARIPLQLLCHSVNQIDAAFGDFMGKKPAVDPPIVAMSFSAVDDSLAPAGHEVLWLWGQYYPYELANGEKWDSIAPAVADNLLDTFEQYAPGTRESVVGQLFQHPEWLERHLHLPRGNVMHLEMSIDQMFMMRPSMQLSTYRGPVDGLYLTGASTHPGGGIMGASGRNAAHVVLQDLS